jgi:DNA sulfur modification protein DndD
LGRLRSTATAIGDLLAVVDGTLNVLQGDYLNRVSERLNALFTEMIGADPEQARVLRGARITSTYDIIVETSEGRTLNPDTELNGAAKRALTFAFIWALTEISERDAPRIIDTPLGMMSGNVKRRVLDLISRPRGTPEEPRPSQVVLFLTRDEIRGTEDLIDAHAGVQFTLTNTDHYPVDLTNEPPPGEPRVLRCECDVHHVCPICSRTDDALFDLQLTEQAAHARG